MTIAEFDFLEGRPLSERISSEKLIKYGRKAYLKFYLTKVFYHPFQVLSLIINIVRIEEVLKEFPKDLRFSWLSAASIVVDH